MLLWPWKLWCLASIGSYDLLWRSRWRGILRSPLLSFIVEINLIQNRETGKYPNAFSHITCSENNIISVEFVRAAQDGRYRSSIEVIIRHLHKSSITQDLVHVLLSPQGGEFWISLMLFAIVIDRCKHYLYTKKKQESDIYNILQ